MASLGAVLVEGLWGRGAFGLVIHISAGRSRAAVCRRPRVDRPSV